MLVKTRTRFLLYREIKQCHNQFTELNILSFIQFSHLLNKNIYFLFFILKIKNNSVILGNSMIYL